MGKRIVSALATAGVLGLAVGGFAVAEHGKGDRGEKRMERAAALDANANGQIERSEIEAGQAARFAAIDTNGDGGLSMAELDAHREAKRAERRARPGSCRGSMRCPISHHPGASTGEHPGRPQR